MNSLISDSRIQNTLNRLHQEAKRDMPNILRGFLRSFGRRLRPEDMARAYISMSAEQGQLMYSLIRSSGARKIVEFGTSFGISTLYLGAAARDNGGHVFTTELLEEKCHVAYQNFKEAGITDVVTLLPGDAMQTLKAIQAPIDFLLLDGWNDLYLPLLKMLEPKLKTGAMILTDNADFASSKPFLNYVRNTPEKYTSTRLKTNKGGTELSCFIGEPFGGEFEKRREKFKGYQLQ